MHQFPCFANKFAIYDVAEAQHINPYLLKCISQKKFQFLYEKDTRQTQISLIMSLSSLHAQHRSHYYTTRKMHLKLKRLASLL